jgi:hypothetical protein
MRLMLPSIACTGIEIAEFQDGQEILERHKGINSPAQKPAPGTGAEEVAWKTCAVECCRSLRLNQ